MSNVYKFPTGERLNVAEVVKQTLSKEEQIEIQKEECVEFAHHCFGLIDDAIHNGSGLFDKMDFLDISTPEAMDMAVVINLLAAAFYRFKGIEHPFQDDLDICNQKLDRLITDEPYSKGELEEIQKEIEELITKATEDDDTD
jgi:hypothetical protein